MLRNLKYSALLAGTVALLGSGALAQPASGEEPPWWLVIAGGGLAVLCGFCMFAGGLARRATRVAMLLVAFLVVQCLGALDSLEPYRSEVSLAGWLVGLAVCFALLLTIENLFQWKATAAALVAIATLVSFLGLIRSGRPFGPVMIPASAVFVSFSLLDVSESGWKRWLLRGLQLLLVVGVLRSQSVAGTLALVAGLLTFAILSSLGVRSTLALLSLLLLAVLAIQGPATWTVGSDPISLRQALLVTGWTAAQERLLLGHGPGTFKLGYQKHRPIGQMPEDNPIDCAHNDYLELVVESGLAGLALWLWVIGAALYRGYRFAWFSDLEEEPAGVTAALVAAATYCLLDGALRHSALVWWFCSLLGLVVALPVSSNYRRSWPLAAHLAVGGFLVVGGIWVAQFGWSNERAASEVEKAAVAEGRGQMEKALRHLDRAGELAPQKWSIAYGRAMLCIRRAESEDDPGLLKEAVDQLVIARKSSPREIEVLGALGSAYLRLAELGLAEEVFRAGSGLAPYSSRFPRGLIDVSLQRRDYKAAAKQAMLLYLVDETQLEPTIKLMRLLAKQNSDFPAEALQLVELPEARLERLFLRTEAAFLESKLYRAADVLRARWRISHPDDHARELELIRRMELTGQLDEAYWRLTELANRPGQNIRDQADMLCEWSLRASERGQRTVAMARLTDLLSKEPSLGKVRLTLIGLKQAANQDDEVMSLVEQGLRLDNSDPDLLVMSGEIRLNKGQLAAAKAQVRRALELQPTNSKAQKLMQLIETIEGP